MTSSAQMKEEPASSDEFQIKQQPKTRRHRASVACTLCRDRRIRCVVPPGKKICIQCDRSSTSCIIKDDDERRRPISRAYVYSLVDRIALLEGLLDGHGLVVPPASHPPEMRQISRKRKEASALEHTPSSTRPPRDSTTSSSHTASSPYSSDDQTRDAQSVARSRNWHSSIALGIDSADEHIGSQTRHDSFIMPTGIKIESPIERPITTLMHESGTCEPDQVSMPPPPNPTAVWPTVKDHASSRTIVYPTPQTTRVDSFEYNTWSDRMFDFQSYNRYLLDLQHSGPFDVEHRNAGVSPTADRPTNLDFMALNATD